MRGLDTNVLVRYLTQDDAGQTRRADALFRNAVEQRERLHVDVIVLCEIVWVLQEVYKYEKNTVLGVLEKILEVAQLSIEDRDLVREGLNAYRAGKGDFADYMIGLRNRRAGCADTATFDRALRDNPLFSAL